MLSHVSMTVIWAVTMILFLIVEGATAGLTSLWFAAGALAAVLASLLHAPLWLQVLLFIGVSALTLYFTRPLVKRYINEKTQATNADRVIGTCCTVTEQIDPLAGTGAVRADGKIWSARSADGSVIPADALVTVQRIEGVKLIVAVQLKQETKLFN